MSGRSPLRLLGEAYDAWMDRSVVPARSALFDERIFVHDDGGWRPERIPPGYTAEEISRLDTVAMVEGLGAKFWLDVFEMKLLYERDFGPLGLERDLPFMVALRDFVKGILQHGDMAAVGSKEPRDHDRTRSLIDPEWLDDAIKVDFKDGRLWARDAKGWRLMFSEILLCRRDFYEATWGAGADALAVSKELSTKEKVLAAAEETPLAKALLDGKEMPRNSIAAAVRGMMKLPILHGLEPDNVTRTFFKLRTGK